MASSQAPARRVESPTSNSRMIFSAFASLSRLRSLLASWWSRSVLARVSAEPTLKSSPIPKNARIQGSRGRYAMPTAVVPGTSLFQIIFVAANVTILQAINNRTVDAVLALLLLVGGVLGAQIGSRIGSHLRGEQLRIMLALLVLMVAVKLAYDMTATPDYLFSVDVVR